MARNNGLSLVAKLNISLSESQISEDLKKISSNLDGKGLPSFIAHLNLSGSASAINKELAELGKKLKVDFGNITNSNNTNKLKQVGKNIAQSIYNVQELKKAGRDYIYNENNIQNQIDKLQSRYDKRGISLANTVNVKAVTDEIGKVKALTVEYQNLENQMVRVNYIKAKFDNKKVGFVSTGATFADSTEGKGYQQTLDFLNKIEATFRRINNQTVGYSSPIKEGSVFYDEYNAKAQSVANSIMKIRESSKVLSVEQKTNIRSIINDFEAYSRTLKESAKGAESLAPKNLDQSVKQGNAELNTMLKNLAKSSQGLGYLKNKFTDIISEINKLRVQLNSVTDNAGFTQYSADLKLVKENIRQFNAELSNNKSQQKLKSEIDGLNAKIISFIKENNNLTDTYKRNLLDLAKQANAAKTSFELKGISGQFNALSNAFTNSENLSRSIRTLNNSLSVSEQKLLEMQGDTAGLDVEFQRVVDKVNKVRTSLSTVSNQNGFKNVKIDVAETKQAINDLYNIWQSRGIANQKMVSTQTLDTMSEKLIKQKNELFGLDAEYNKLSNKISELQAKLSTSVDKKSFAAVSAEISVLQQKLTMFYNEISARQNTNIFTENVWMQLEKIDANVRSVASSIAKDNTLLSVYNNELNKILNDINNITGSTTTLSQTQQLEIRKIVEGFKLYEAELQKVASQNLKPSLGQDVSVYEAKVKSMITKLEAMNKSVTDGMYSSYNNVRLSIRNLLTDISNISDEKGLMDFIVKFRLAQETFNQFSNRLNGDTSIETLDTKIKTLSSDIKTYLDTNLTLPNSYKSQIGGLMTQLNSVVSVPQFNAIKAQWHELVNTINSEVVKIGNVPLNEKIITSTSSLETLRQSIISQKGDVGNLDVQYKALLAEIDRLKANSTGIISADQFALWNNEIENVRIKYDQLRNSIKSTTEINQLSVQAANLSSKINLFISQNTKLSENAKQKLRELANQAEQAKSKMELNSINTQFSTFTNKLKEADKLGTSIFSKLATNAKKFTSWFGMTTVIMRTISLIRNMINNVKELDTAMTNLKKVTDETDQTYKNFFESVGKSAQELHADMTNLIDATAEFAKLGYNIGQAEELAKIATVYKNVGINLPICYSNVA